MTKEEKRRAYQRAYRQRTKEHRANYMREYYRKKCGGLSRRPPCKPVLTDEYNLNNSVLMEVNEDGNVILPIGDFLASLNNAGVKYNEFVYENKFGIEFLYE